MKLINFLLSVKIKIIFVLTVFFLFVYIGIAVAQNKQENLKLPSGTQSYYRARPGEIIFEKGAVIVGKVEKPQVMIVIPKEAPKIDSLEFNHSFISELLTPLHLNLIKGIE